MDMTDRNQNDAIPSEFLARTEHWNGDITICSEKMLSQPNLENGILERNQSNAYLYL